ncbi:unnamed protein product [Cuscuta campestris]|uniref:Replication protein A 70 kDa DNA-binding subunit B/D first OB fold domain-containing protein n=1 Tax=Cuscuta campestris TaxID=132261 RepID=A0A484LC46_9ASTE|nr:unnamed protein product [Cuscuta campestris]
MASKPIHPLLKINPSSECRRVLVRVISLYKMPVYNDEKMTNSIEMIFMDEHETTIHVTVRKTLVGTFEKKIKEGSVYVFAYFSVGNRSGYYRTSRHDFRLNFQARTTVTETRCDKIPLYGIRLVAFPEILHADSNYPYLVDTMGILTATGNERDILRESKRTKMIVITLEAEGQRLDVTLFGEYVDLLKGFFRQAPLEHAVIVIQYAKVKMFQDRKLQKIWVTFGSLENLLNFSIENSDQLLFRWRNPLRSWPIEVSA